MSYRDPIKCPLRLKGLAILRDFWEGPFHKLPRGGHLMISADSTKKGAYWRGGRMLKKKAKSSLS